MIYNPLVAKLSSKVLETISRLMISYLAIRAETFHNYAHII